jgi:hypothetical protein
MVKVALKASNQTEFATLQSALQSLPGKSSVDERAARLLAVMQSRGYEVSPRSLRHFAQVAALATDPAALAIGATNARSVCESIRELASQHAALFAPQVQELQRVRADFTTLRAEALRDMPDLSVADKTLARITAAEARLRASGHITQADRAKDYAVVARQLTRDERAARAQAASQAQGMAGPSQPKYSELQALFERPVPPELAQSLERRWSDLDARRSRLAGTINFSNPADPLVNRLNESLLTPRTQLSRSHFPKAVGQNVAVMFIDNWISAERAVSLAASRGEKLSIERLKEINRALGEGLSLGGADQRQRGFGPRAPQYGDYRTQPQGPTAAQHRKYLDPSNRGIERALNDFFAWLDAAESVGMHPVKIAAQVYMRLTSIHPFPDGNGRTARLAMNWVLQSHGYPPAALDVYHFPRMFALDNANVIPGPGATELEVTEAVERSLAMAEDLIGP